MVSFWNQKQNGNIYFKIILEVIGSSFFKKHPTDLLKSFQQSITIIAYIACFSFYHKALKHIPLELLMLFGVV